jgi:hypothetical protein
MPKPTCSVSKGRLHRQSGQAIVMISGRDLLLIQHGLPVESFDQTR